MHNENRFHKTLSGHYHIHRDSSFMHTSTFYRDVLGFPPNILTYLLKQIHQAYQNLQNLFKD